MVETTFDPIVIDGGSGGYRAAVWAAQRLCQLGLYPPKALLRSAEVCRAKKRAEGPGLSEQGASFDLAKIVARPRAVAAQLRAGVKRLMKKNKVAVFCGLGRLAGAGKVKVAKVGRGAAALSARQFILATGARARRGKEWSRTASWCGTSAKRCRPTLCRSGCWRSALAPSA